jgi:uncharacterized protein
MSPYERLAQRARLVARAGATDVPSPCVSLCRMSSKTELCLGCFRTLDEIALWGRMADASKLQVWRSIEQRIAQRQSTPGVEAQREQDA